MAEQEKPREASAAPTQLDPIKALVEVGHETAHRRCDFPTEANDSDKRRKGIALHAFLHEVVAAGFRMHDRVPPEQASPIVVNMLKEVLDKLGYDVTPKKP